MSVGATIEFHGAAGEVTGSCTLVKTPKARILIDFGMFQGTPADEARNAIPPEIDFALLDAIVVTHAHRPLRPPGDGDRTRVSRQDLLHHRHA